MTELCTCHGEHNGNKAERPYTPLQNILWNLELFSKLEQRNSDQLNAIQEYSETGYTQELRDTATTIMCLYQTLGRVGTTKDFLKKTIDLWNGARDNPSKEKKLFNYLLCMRDQTDQYIQQINTLLELLEEQFLHE